MKAKGCLIVCLFIVLLAGCGGSAAHPTALFVVRNNPPLLHLPPFSKKITDSKDVQNLYNAALNLPSIAGNINCTTSSYGGLSYQMKFMSGNNGVENMNLDAATCKLLTIGKSDVRQTNTAFLNLFIKTLGIPALLPAT
jgi:hypothetical protein